MKIVILSLSLLLASTYIFGQRKSNVDPKDLKIDSLTKVTSSLSLKLDSLSGELVKYLGLYNTIREKVIHYPFDPTRSAYLIDSLAAKRDSTSAFLALNQKTSISPSDSIKVTPAATNLTVIPIEDIEMAKAISGLKQLKELLDTKIITDTEFLTLKKKYLEKL